MFVMSHTENHVQVLCLWDRRSFTKQWHQFTGMYVHVASFRDFRAVRFVKSVMRSLAAETYDDLSWSGFV